MDHGVLVNAGLSEREANVYMAALRLGQASLSSLARASAIKKTTLYPHIESLLQRGFLRKTVLRKRFYYAAENPKKILTTFDKSRAEFERDLPKLLATYKSAAHEPAVRVYTGKEELSNLYSYVAATALFLKWLLS